MTACFIPPYCFFPPVYTGITLLPTVAAIPNTPRAAGNRRRSSLWEQQAASSVFVAAKASSSSKHKIFLVSYCNETFDEDLANRKNNQSHDSTAAVL